MYTINSTVEDARIEMRSSPLPRREQCCSSGYQRSSSRRSSRRCQPHDSFIYSRVSLSRTVVVCVCVCVCVCSVCVCVSGVLSLCDSVRHLIVIIWTWVLLVQAERLELRSSRSDWSMSHSSLIAKSGRASSYYYL